MQNFKVSQGIGDGPRPVVYLYEGTLELTIDGVEYDYRFFYEYDERDGQKTLEFTEDEPPMDFDREEFENYCQDQVEASWEGEEV